MSVVRAGGGGQAVAGTKGGIKLQQALDAGFGLLLGG